MVRPTLLDMIPNELKYYPFMISLNKCAVSWNVSFPKIYVPKETKDINVKAYNMIRNKDEVKAMTIHFMWLQMQIQQCNRFNTASIDLHSKKESDCYILHTVLLAIILLLIITIICYHYAKRKGIM